jgi:hypothetical protein
VSVHEDRTRLILDAVLQEYRPVRTDDGDLWLVGAAGDWVPLARPFDVARAVITDLAVRDSDSIPSWPVIRSVIDVLSGRARGVEPEALPHTAEDQSEPVDTYDDLADESGAELLDDVLAFVTSYCVFAFVELGYAVALWIMHCHVFDVFTTTPRLLVKAPTVECGKTRVLEAIEPLVPGPSLAISVSGAYLFRTIGRRDVTILLDEYEGVWRDGSDQGIDIRAIVNAGYRKGAMVGRVVPVGPELVPTEFPVFCPFALAGVGWAPDSVRTRSIPISMRRRRSDEDVEGFERDDAWELAAPLARRLRAWAARNRDHLDRKPTLPDGLEDRPAELWRPLFSVAARAGGRWPARTEAACAKLLSDHDDEDLSTGLLAHVRSVFDGTDVTDPDDIRAGVRVERIWSADLVERLCAREDWPWESLKGGPLTPSGLAKRLKEFGVIPTTIRIGDRTKRGYERSQFEDVWTRFIQDPPLVAQQPQQPQQPWSASSRHVAPVAPVAPERGGSAQVLPLEGSAAAFEDLWNAGGQER